MNFFNRNKQNIVTTIFDVVKCHNLLFHLSRLSFLDKICQSYIFYNICQNVYKKTQKFEAKTDKFQGETVKISVILLIKTISLKLKQLLIKDLFQS